MGDGEIMVLSLGSFPPLAVSFQQSAGTEIYQSGTMNFVDMVDEGTSPLQYLVVAGSPRRLQGNRPNLHRVKVLA
jgi:hypothetical protein